MNIFKRITNEYSVWDKKQNILSIKKSYIIQLRNLIFPSWAEAERQRDIYIDKYNKLKLAKNIIQIDKIRDKTIKTDGVAYFDCKNATLVDCNFYIKLDKRIPDSYSLVNFGGENIYSMNCCYFNKNNNT